VAAYLCHAQTSVGKQKLTATQADRKINDLLSDLRLHAKSRKFLVPSASHPHHQNQVHLTESDKRKSCTCEAHKSVTRGHASTFSP
jgi:hypothetical protein